MSVAEAHSLLNECPEWESTQDIEEEIERRFSRVDK
jgi:hypothetical protein